MSGAGTISQSAMRRVLFDPLSWLPDACTPIVVPAPALSVWRSRASALAAAWINQVIIDTHGLTCVIAPCERASIEPWIDRWWRLRRMAYLIGCRCLRSELVVRQRFGSLDPRARAFALLPVAAPPPYITAHRVDDHLEDLTGDSAGFDIATCVDAHRDPLDDTGLIAQGYLCLFHAAPSSVDGLRVLASPVAHTALGPALSPAWSAVFMQRVALMFADARARLIDIALPSARHRASPTLIENAIRHASIDSNPLLASRA